MNRILPEAKKFISPCRAVVIADDLRPKLSSFSRSSDEKREREEKEGGGAVERERLVR